MHENCKDSEVKLGDRVICRQLRKSRAHMTGLFLLGHQEIMGHGVGQLTGSCLESSCLMLSPALLSSLYLLARLSPHRGLEFPQHLYVFNAWGSPRSVIGTQ